MSTETLVLGIESSCDETAAAIVRGGRTVLSSIVASQVDLHRQYRGVVPEVACREHLRVLIPTVRSALDAAGVAGQDVDAIAVTTSPGLIGALLLGASCATTLGIAWKKPVLGVSHIEGHLYAPALTGRELPYPLVSLVVSGGHTSLFVSRSPLAHSVLGSTVDDAAGEAFDKVAAILDLPYPGGPSIEREAKAGDPTALPFKRPMLAPGSLDFSFSGLKTAVLYACYGQDGRRDRSARRADVSIPDVAASFQAAAVDVLTRKVRAAVAETGIRTVAVGGGVACNGCLRSSLQAAAAEDRFDLILTPPNLCTDNAAMIAGLGHHAFLASRGAPSSLAVSARGSWPRVARHRPA